MSDYNVLELTLNAIIDVLKPLREDWETRIQIINDLRGLVASVEGLQGAAVEPFGSFLSNLFTRWGDLDISIELPNGSYISPAAKKRKQTLLRNLLRALRLNGGWHSLQFIPHARVPILKSVSNHQGIFCDISVDNLPGLVKSKFLLWINEIDGRFREMVLLVKEWAKAHDINNPKTGTLNSYSLSLLVIFHFQTCVPAILPPLKEIYPRNVVDDLTGVRNDAIRRISDTCTTQIARLKSDKSRAVNRSSISELYLSFLAKFSDLSPKASQFAICPFNGKWEEIECNTQWLPKTYAIFIEDPFEQPENTARSVCPRHLERISGAFMKTYYKLVGNHNQNSVINTLTTPQISRFVPRTQVNIPSHGGAAGSYSGYHDSTAAPRPRTPAMKVGYGHHGNTLYGSPSYNGVARTVSSPSSSNGTDHPQAHVVPQLNTVQHQARSSKPKGYYNKSYNIQTPAGSNLRRY